MGLLWLFGVFHICIKIAKRENCLLKVQLLVHMTIKIVYYTGLAIYAVFGTSRAEISKKLCSKDLAARRGGESI